MNGRIVTWIQIKIQIRNGLEGRIQVNSKLILNNKCVHFKTACKHAKINRIFLYQQKQGTPSIQTDKIVVT